MNAMIRTFWTMLLTVALVGMPLVTVASEVDMTEVEMTMPTEEQMAEMAQFFEMQLATFPAEKQAELRAKLEDETLSEEEIQALVNEIMAGGGMAPAEMAEVDVEVSGDDAE